MPLLRDRTAWLQGGESRCLQPPPEVRRTWRLVLLGPPGVGKGTQAAFLSNALGACPLSTGDVFRAAHHQTPPAGSPMAVAQAAMHRGELVGDDTVLALIAERDRCLHCRGGFMLDGFPRTLAQAEALDALLAAGQLQLDAAISYELPATELVARLGGRLVCERCKSVFHSETHRPRRAGLCDKCAAPLTQRPDDRPESVRVRLDAYAATATPVKEHYRRQSRLLPILADGPPKEIFAHTLDALAALNLPP